MLGALASGSTRLGPLHLTGPHPLDSWVAADELARLSGPHTVFRLCGPRLALPAAKAPAEDTHPGLEPRRGPRFQLCHPAQSPELGL